MGGYLNGKPIYGFPRFDLVANPNMISTSKNFLERSYLAKFRLSCQSQHDKHFLKKTSLKDPISQTNLADYFAEVSSSSQIALNTSQNL